MHYIDRPPGSCYTACQQKCDSGLRLGQSKEDKDETEKVDLFTGYMSLRPLNVPKYSDVEIIEALRVAHGNISAAASILQVRRRYVKERIDRVPEVREFYEEVKDLVLDRAEQNIMVDVFKGDQVASKFVLTTLGKDRGYTTRSEMTGKDGEPLTDEKGAEAIDALRRKLSSDASS